MTSYSTRNTNATTTGSQGNTAGRNEVGILDKLVGKTEQKIGELKKNPKMQVQGVIRSSQGKAAAKNLKDNDYTKAIGNTGISSGKHNSAQDAGQEDIHPASSILKITSHPTGTDNAVGTKQENLADQKLRWDPNVQIEGDRTTDGKRTTKDLRDKSNPDATALTSGHNDSSNTNDRTKTHTIFQIPGYLPDHSHLSSSTLGSCETIIDVNDPAHPSSRTKGLNNIFYTTASDKVGGKTEEGLDEMKKDLRLEQEGAVRSKSGSPSAKHFKYGAHTGMTSLEGGPGTGGLSPEYHTSSRGVSDAGSPPTTSSFDQIGQFNNVNSGFRRQDGF